MLAATSAARSLFALAVRQVPATAPIRLRQPFGFVFYFTFLRDFHPDGGFVMLAATSAARSLFALAVRQVLKYHNISVLK